MLVLVAECLFPLILLQAKAGGWLCGRCYIGTHAKVSINSPSGEGGGLVGTEEAKAHNSRFH